MQITTSIRGDGLDGVDNRRWSPSSSRCPLSTLTLSTTTLLHSVDDDYLILVLAIICMLDYYITSQIKFFDFMPILMPCQRVHGTKQAIGLAWHEKDWLKINYVKAMVQLLIVACSPPY